MAGFSPHDVRTRVRLTPSETDLQSKGSLLCLGTAPHTRPATLGHLSESFLLLFGVFSELLYGGGKGLSACDVLAIIEKFLGLMDLLKPYSESLFHDTVLTNILNSLPGVSRQGVCSVAFLCPPPMNVFAHP